MKTNHTPVPCPDKENPARKMSIFLVEDYETVLKFAEQIRGRKDLSIKDEEKSTILV